MAEIHKISGYLIDPNGDIGANDIEVAVTDQLDVFSQHLHIETAEIEGWDDDNPLNYKNCDLAECEKYFKADPTKGTGSDRVPEVGATYRHFKGEKIVKVLAISQDTENVGSYSVVYECKDKDNNTKIWHRPYEMFISEVDHVKYPDAKQKYRFEKVED